MLLVLEVVTQLSVSIIIAVKKDVLSEIVSLLSFRFLFMLKSHTGNKNSDLP